MGLHGIGALLTLGRPGAQQGGPTNTVAPAIATDAVIGTLIEPTPGTWTGDPVLTYQWQRYVSSAWADISGATDIDRAPVDADFGYALRLAEIPDGDAAKAAYSNATGLVAEAPAQSLSDIEKVTNGNMEAGSPPSNWAASDATLSSVADERTGGAGAKSISVARNGAANAIATQGIATTAGMLFEFAGWKRNVDAAGGARFVLRDSGGTFIYTSDGYYASTTWLNHLALVRAIGPTTEIRLTILAATDPTSSRFDDVSVRALTTNIQITAPAANMRITQAVTLPASPASGTQVWLKTRISDDAAGNYWNTVLEYTGSQWNITTYSVASFGRTSRITAANVGAVTHVRLNMNADAISLYVSADGETFTQRGSTINNSTYQTATGVNVLATSDVTLGNLEYAPAD